ncbi:GGDEF domain-containing protein [[Acidovorax] ebreus]|nr:sensor domain-containing diguanylate cyclase [[Acidovorax] ebreus]
MHLERQALAAAPGPCVVWLPGQPPQSWREAMQWLQHRPTTGHRDNSSPLAGQTYSSRQLPILRPRTGRRGLAQRTLDALITTDPHQRIRLAMAGLSALLMLGCIGAMHLVAAAGLTDPVPVYWWTLACGAGITTVFVLIRSGASRRFADPSLTLFQIVYVIAGPARGIAPPILAVIMMFGVFGLTPRQMVGVALYGLVAFGAAGAVVQWWHPAWLSPDSQPPALSAAYLVMIAVVLASSTFLTTRVHSARARLRSQKRELAAAVEQIRELAIRDELTGLPNRRCMLEMMRLEHARAQRSRQPLLLAQLDLDHFKAVNDTHGHAAGDVALQSFAQTVHGCVRASDLLARWGGEEFLLLMANTHPADGTRLLERVRATVAATPVALPGGTQLSLTVSVGLAELAPGESTAALLQRADAALYGAKRLGRNRVLLAH